MPEYEEKDFDLSLIEAKYLQDIEQKMGLYCPYKM